MSEDPDSTSPDSDMETLHTCQDCGAVMPASHTGTLCPKCVLGLAAEPPAAQLGEAEGDVIGSYALRQKIGEGGFGVVWMAEQSQPMSRMVALKVVKAGMDTKQVLARFEAEQQALALLDHPNIAKVLDAGATETGRPYFVMELVKGIPITQFCQEQKLATKARLELFRDVCSAINHAHQKGIIHRDLKPSNVMVTLHGDKPVAKVIDFGIAKATQQKLTDKTLFTRFEQFLGTPVYMSPEQAALSGLDIDTRSDIYSLGVLLYELLAGKPPFDPKTLLSKGYEEMRRIIREEEPPKPSTKLTETQSSAGNKFVNVSPTALKGELDWIIMKAIDKDRGRRYETANAFAADIGRYLENEPVLAAAPSAAYKFRKFARRNKTVLGVAAAMVALLLGGIVATSWQAVRATAERDRAEEAREEAEGISSFLIGMFESARPGEEKGGREVKVADVLDDAAKKLETDLLDQPARRAKLQAAIGGTYSALGLSREALQLKEQALKYHQTHSGPKHPETLNAMRSLASSYNSVARYEEALALGEEALQLFCEVIGPEHPDTLKMMTTLAFSYEDLGKNEKALLMREKTLELHRKVNGQEHPSTLSAWHNLVNSYSDLGRHDEVLQMREAILELRRKVNGPEHPDTLMAMNNLAVTYRDVGRGEDALLLHEKGLELSRIINGPEHPDTLLPMRNLGYSYHDVGRKDEALDLHVKALELSRRVNGPEHPGTLRAMQDLAHSYEEFGRLAEALSIREDVLEIRRRVSGPEHPETLSTMNNLTLSYCKVDRSNDAVAMGEAALKLSRKVNGPDHPETIRMMITLSLAYRDVDRYDEVLRMRESALTLSRKVNGAQHPMTLAVLTGLALSYEDVGRIEEALEMSEELLKLRRKIIGPEHPDTLSAWHNLADLYRDVGRPGEALEMQEEILALRRKINGPDHPDTLRAMRNLARSYAIAGRLDKSIPLRESLIESLEKVYGKEADSTLAIQASLAASYSNSGQPEKALPLMEKALLLQRKLFGPKHPNTLENQNNLIITLGMLKRFDAAIEGAMEFLPLAREVYGPLDTMTIQAVERLVHWYLQVGQINDARELQKGAWAQLAPAPPTLKDASPASIRETLVPPTSTWRWLHPTDGVDPAAEDPDFHITFHTKDFDDSSWHSGLDRDDNTGGFGYGDPWFTGVDIGKPKQTSNSAYFRTQFTTKEAHQLLELHCQRDDGIIVYLNGKEVARNNVSPGKESYRLSATDGRKIGPSHQLESQQVRIPLQGGLTAGDHILAISLHNGQRSSDLRVGAISLVEVEPPSEATLTAAWNKVLADFHRSKGEAAAQRRQWKEALGHFESCRENQEHWLAKWDNLRYLALLAFLGEREKHRALCAELLSEYARTKNPELLSSAPMAVLMYPPGPNVDENLATWQKEAHRLATMRLREATDAQRHPGMAVHAGTAEYRVGNFPKAEELLSEALGMLGRSHYQYLLETARDSGQERFDSSTAMAFARRAMARHAQELVEKARNDLRQGLRCLPPPNHSSGWWDIIFAYLALREAWDLIEGKDKESDVLDNWAKSS